MKLEPKIARDVLLKSAMGAAAHAAQSRHLVMHLIEKCGNARLVGGLPAHLTKAITGTAPESAANLLDLVGYVEEQLTLLVASANAGQEGASLDLESKTLHAGMLDLLAMEIAEIAQASFLGFLETRERMVEMGVGVLDAKKPVVICIGHNSTAPAYILDYMERNSLLDSIEIGGLCCTGHEMSRYSKTPKIIGPMSKELEYIRSGIPDVIVTDEQCIRADVLKEAKLLHIPVIATNEAVTHGLPDLTGEDVSCIMDGLIGGHVGALILDPKKVGELVPELALKMRPIRKTMGMTGTQSDEEFRKAVSECNGCLLCTRECPKGLPIADAMKVARTGDTTPFEALHHECIGCGKCDHICPMGIPVQNVIEKASRRAIMEEKSKIRVGTVQISEHEIEMASLKAPGIVAFIGCSNYPDSAKGIYEAADEMLGRGYIVMASGCAAMDLGVRKNGEGMGLYERYPGRFAGGNFMNMGPCVSNARIAGVAIGMTSLLSGMPVSGNWEGMADYVLSHVGIVGVAWGPYSQKVFSTIAGFNRLGIPVIVGPRGASYYGRTLVGNKSVIPQMQPEHLMVAARSKEELVPLMAKLCLRPGDGGAQRSLKLAHYAELCEKYPKTPG